MTPAELHAAIVARVQERLALAQAASRGPWVAKFDDANDSAELEAPDGHTVAVVAWCDDHPRMARPNFALFAANDPAFTIRMCQATLNRLGEHRPVHTSMWKIAPQLDGLLIDYVCAHSWGPGIATKAEPWPCPDVRAEAAVWKVEVDSELA